MTNSIISTIEDLIDELEDLAYEHKADLLTAKRNEINFAIKHLRNIFLGGKRKTALKI